MAQFRLNIETFAEVARLNGFNEKALIECLGEYSGPELTAPIIQAVIKRFKMAALDTLLSDESMSSVQVISYSPDNLESDVPWLAGMPLLRPSAFATDVSVRWLSLDRYVTPTTLCRIQATFELHPLLTKELASLTKRGGTTKTQLRRCDDEWLFLTVPVIRLTCESKAAEKARSDKAKAKKKLKKGGLDSQAAEMKNVASVIGSGVCDWFRLALGMQDSASKAAEKEARQPLFVQVESAYLALFVARPSTMTMWAGDETPLGPDAKGDTIISFVTSFKVPSVSAARDAPSAARLEPGESERYEASQDITKQMRENLLAHRSLVRSGDASWSAVTFIDDALRALQPVLAAYRHQISDMSDLVHNIQGDFPRKDVKAMIDTRVEIEFIKRKVQPTLRVLDSLLQEVLGSDPPLARHIEDSKVSLEWAMEEFTSLLDACDSIKEESAAYRSMQYAIALESQPNPDPCVCYLWSNRRWPIPPPPQAARRSLHPHTGHGVHHAAPVPHWPVWHELHEHGRWKPGRPATHSRQPRVHGLLGNRGLPDQHLYLGLPAWPDGAARYWTSGQAHQVGWP